MRRQPVFRVVDLGLPAAEAFSLFLREIAADGVVVERGGLTVDEPGRTVSFRVGHDGSAGTTVEVTFVQEPGGSQLRLEHSGWTDENASDRAGFDGPDGWDLVLAGFLALAGARSGVRVDVLGWSDAARLRDLRRRALAADPDAFFRSAAEEESIPLEAWAESLGDPAARWVVAVVEGDADGADVGLACARPSAQDAPDLEVVSVWVDRAARGRGVARLLVTDLVEHARRGDVPGLRLWVADRNLTATALYEGLGFVSTGRTGEFPPPRSFPEHELRLDLRPTGPTDAPRTAR